MMIQYTFAEMFEQISSAPEEKTETKLFDSKKRKGDDPKELTDLEIKIERKKQNLIEYYELLEYWSKIKRHKWIKDKMKEIKIEINIL